MRRSASVSTNERTGASSYSARIASAQARISSRLFASPKSATSEGRSWASRRSCPRTVSANLVSPVLDQVVHAPLDRDAHLWERHRLAAP
jgi:hypothetical protein